MNKRHLCNLLAIALPLLLAVSLHAAKLTNLCCKCRADPLGIDGRPIKRAIVAMSELGCSATSGVSRSAGTANTGGGCSGALATGGAGGSGIVIVRYRYAMPGGTLIMFC